MKNVLKLYFSLVLLSYAKAEFQSAHGNRVDSFIEFYTDPESVLRVYMSPCSDSGTKNTLVEPMDLPRHTQNPYFVFIKDYFDVDTEMEVTLSSAATIYFDDRIDAFIRPISNLTFGIKFEKWTTALMFLIERSKQTIVPYVATLKINGKEFCKDEIMPMTVTEGQTSVSYEYIEQYKNFEQITLPVHDNVCGTRKVEHTGLIVNGLPTKPGDWPWHAAIYRISKATLSYICGGTLISKYHVLTAAHCVTKNDSPILPELLSVVLGKYNLRGGDNTAVEKEVHDIKIHNMFNSRNFSNDIALLKLDSSVEYTDYIQPACLWQNALHSKLRKRVYGTVVGWGIDHTDQLSSQLQQVRIPMIKDVTCLKSNRVFYGTKLDGNNFCAGYLNGTSACNGDSGGGFTIPIEGRHYVRGIVSLALARDNENKCDPNQYVLFTDVENYVSWIRTSMK